MNTEMMHPQRILLVDDEEGLLTLLRITLNKERYHHIQTAGSGAEALRLVQTNAFELIVLDVMLPDCSGFDLCTEIRRHTPAPIIFLSACASDFDKLSGLTVGGDDYVTKPFNTMELVARIKAIFRRQQLDREHAAPGNTTAFDYGAIAVFPEQGVLRVRGQSMECTAKEMELLTFFCRNPNRIFSVTQLYDAVWGATSVGDEKTVSIYISRLRKKLQDEADSPVMIVNIRGLGYKFVPPAKDQS